MINHYSLLQAHKLSDLRRETYLKLEGVLGERDLRVSLLYVQRLRMNKSPSECSSGCESGWTIYLDQHFNSTDQYSKTSDKNYQRKGTHVNEEEDAYDLSMVSDASSGPPQVDVYENCAEKNKKSKKKNEIKEQKREEKNLYLDDTASSPLCNFSQDILGLASTHTSMDHVPGFSQALPASHFQKHFGFFKSSQKQKTASTKSGSLLGRKRQ